MDHPRLRKRNGAVVYRGPSQLTGDPIVAVVTGLALKSNNVKTGDMLQAWILVAGMDPTTAIRTGADRAVCGDCALRGDGVHGRGCYVTYWQAPLRVYRTLHEKPEVDPWVLRDALKGRWLRLSGYGDPVAVPLVVWAALLSKAGGWLGYTQQWRTCDPGYQRFLMASCLSQEDQHEAVAKGWRTYRIRRPSNPVLLGEVVCPASREAGHKLTCVDCGVCQGSGVARPNVVIMAHGKAGNLNALGVSSAGRGFGRPPSVHPMRVWSRASL